MQDTYQYQETARTRQPRRNPQALFFFGWLCAIDWTTNRTAAAAAAGAAAAAAAAVIVLLPRRHADHGTTKRSSDSAERRGYNSSNKREDLFSQRNGDTFFFSFCDMPTCLMETLEVDGDPGG